MNPVTVPKERKRIRYIHSALYFIYIKNWFYSFIYYYYKRIVDENEIPKRCKVYSSHEKSEQNEQIYATQKSLEKHLKHPSRTG